MSFRISVLISGGGTTLKNLLAVHAAGNLSVEIVNVVSSNPSAGGLEYARAANISTTTHVRKEFENTAEFSQAIFQDCRDANSDLIVMGGFLKRVKIPDDFVNRVINIHPSLIPAFCGKGCYGNRVHQGVIDYGCKISGCTVHLVDDQYDHGPIIAQQTVPVQNNDDAATLAARIFEKECEIYPQVINAFAENRIQIEGRKVTVLE